MKHCSLCDKTYPDALRFCPDDGALLSLRDPYHLVGRTLAAKYRLDALVGIGGMGAVYSAYHLALDRRVAFKILQPNLTLGNARTLDLFEREAKIAGRLAHENIVMVLDAGRTDDDLAYIAMEWLDGHTLEEELRLRGRLSLEQAAEILRQVAAALDAAHAERIIHRDLKPANIMLIRQTDRRVRVKVLDFGIAKILSETAGSPVSSVMGTPHYASPEQFQLRSRIDGRADIYSLGVALFQMLTGALPFEATSMHELIRMHLTESPPPLRKFRPEAPAAVEQLLERMLSKEPEGRPSHVGEIPALFDRALNLAPDQEKVEVQREEQERLHALYDAPETAPAASSASSQPSPALPILPGAADPTVKPLFDSARRMDESNSFASQSLRTQRGSRWKANRMKYLIVSLALIFATALAIAISRFISANIGQSASDKIKVEPTGKPTGQVRSEPNRSPAQTQPVNGRWIINNDDTILDTQTDLMWMRKDFRVIEGRFVNGWQEAMSWAEKMNNQRYAGHNDWKVPSISEYKSIRDKVPKVFEREGEDCYWSRNEISKSVASYIYMTGKYGGAAVSGAKIEGTNKPGSDFNGKFSVRLVRQSK
ncbi:MAG: protein kinase [Chloracidobacterium sp.]|nr:protein kinase [Chloracidobacterium sp.]